METLVPQHKTSTDELKKTIAKLAVRGKGLLAADESTATITKRFSALNIPCTEETRRDYRELLLSTPEIERYIAGVILYEETLAQKTKAGFSFADLLNQKGILPGIKVDKGLVVLPGTSGENVTQGLDSLLDRLMKYKEQGAQFAKWRAVYAISNTTPSLLAIKANAEMLAMYAAICQEAGIVPIVEPEVLIDGEHNIEASMQISEEVLHAVFHALHQHKVKLEYIILKPSMVTPGKQFKGSMDSQEVAHKTITVLRRTVPAAVPTINFLSGGQTPEQATANLNAMNQMKSLPWNVSFSYARALQEPCMKIWAGKAENINLAQQKFIHRSKLNSLACLGDYDESKENLEK